MTTINEPLGRRLRMALIGGAGSGFIGRVHYAAATLDHRAELVAGALSSDPERGREAAAEFGIIRERAYGDVEALLEGEAALPEDRRVDFVSIATPNFTHYGIARAALLAGLHVVCDKPMAVRLEQAVELAGLVAESGAVFAVTHAYAGYPLVRQIRQMVAGGEIGQVLAVRVRYIQGGVWREVPGEPPTRAAWKRDPAKTGPSGTIGDIGTHAYHLMRYCTGLFPDSLCCSLGNFHPARPLDDYGHVVFRFPDGALGTLTASQVSHGRLNDVEIEIDGTTGSLCWRQQRHDQLLLRRYGRPLQAYECNRSAGFLDETVRSRCRLPGGHPEGFLGAFANIYGDAFDAMVSAGTQGRIAAADANTVYPDVIDGLEGVLFVEQCVASHRDGSVWLPFHHELCRGMLPDAR